MFCEFEQSIPVLDNIIRPGHGVVLISLHSQLNNILHLQTSPKRNLQPKLNCQLQLLFNTKIIQNIIVNAQDTTKHKNFIFPYFLSDSNFIFNFEFFLTNS